MDREETGDSVTGFTLIELVITIAISTMVVAALYFSLRGALDSWSYSNDQLLLQQVSSQVMEEIAEGLPDTYGLRDVLEIVEALPQSITVVLPWTDDTHDVYSGITTYTLNKHIKPGTGLPIAEVLLPESKTYKVVPVTVVDQGKSDDYPEVRTKIGLVAGSRLRFTFHPDFKLDGDVLTTLRFDGATNAVFIDDKDGSREVSKNNFGVKIKDFLLRYYDNTNKELGLNGSVSGNEIPFITALEVAFKAESRERRSRESVTFISLRNAQMHTGNLILREGSKIPIPDSGTVKAFFLTNLTGIENNDMIVLDARPESGKGWLITIQFSKAASTAKPLIASYTIEYPSGNIVYSYKPRTPAELGLNLMTLGTNGRYDYDDDGFGEEVALKGKVSLEVRKMDIGGAAVFVKP